MKEQDKYRTCQYYSTLKYENSVQLPQPLLIHTDQPPVACSDQSIKLISLWDDFFFSKFEHQI